LTLITQGTFTAIMATSVGLLIHQCGLISFGHATFFGLGAYITWGLLTIYWKFLKQFNAFELIGWRITTSSIRSNKRIAVSIRL
jgi:ABC-type branched-subunit amino acid transport system permease subunit